MYLNKSQNDLFRLIRYKKNKHILSKNKQIRHQTFYNQKRVKCFTECYFKPPYTGECCSCSVA